MSHGDIYSQFVKDWTSIEHDEEWKFEVSIANMYLGENKKIREYKRLSSCHVHKIKS